MNTLKTVILMALLTAILVLLGAVFGGETGLVVMLAVSLLMNVGSYWFSDSIVLKMYSAREVSYEEEPELYRLVNNLAAKADLPMPKLCIIDSPAPNAFATGRNPSHAAVAVTTGIRQALDQDELAGVIAHELSHIKHRDTLISTVAACIAGSISALAQWLVFFNSDDDEGPGIVVTILTLIIAPFAAMLIQMAISRSREYSADESGGEICGNPLFLARALQKIEYFAQNQKPLATATNATAHMCIINPFTSGKLVQLFSTHPATAERIQLLEEQAKKLGNK